MKNVGIIIDGSIARYEMIRHIVDNIAPSWRRTNPETLYAVFIDVPRSHPYHPPNQLTVSAIKMGSEGDTSLLDENDMIVDTVEEFEMEVVKLKLLL